jgi:hypothetical protein
LSGTEWVDIDDLFVAHVLAALFNNARVSYNPFVVTQIVRNPPMDVDEAQELVDASYQDLYFHRIQGRLLRVNLNVVSFSPALYDRQHGPGSAACAVAYLRETGRVSMPEDMRQSQPLPEPLQTLRHMVEGFAGVDLF